MNVRIQIASLSLLFVLPAAAQEQVQSLPPVHVEQTVQYVFDCEQRKLPSQRQVGEWTGQHNFSQVYDTRTRLMAELGRSCQKNGIEQVQVVSRYDATTRDLRLVAVADRRRR